MDGTNHSIFRLVASLAAELIGAAKVVLLFCRSVEDRSFPDHHNPTDHLQLRRLPNITHNQRVQDVAVPIEDVKPKSAATLRIAINVALHQLHALHGVHDAELIHHLLAALEQQLAIGTAVFVLLFNHGKEPYFDVHSVRHAQQVEAVALGLVAVDKGEVVLAHVLVLGLERVTAAQQSQNLALVLIGRCGGLVGRQRDFQLTTRDYGEELVQDIILSINEMAARERPLVLLFIQNVDVLQKPTGSSPDIGMSDLHLCQFAQIVFGL